MGSKGNDTGTSSHRRRPSKEDENDADADADETTAQDDSSPTSQVSTAISESPSSPAVKDMEEDVDMDTAMPRGSHWFQSMAIFGDSTFALGVSFGLLLLSVGMAWYLDNDQMPQSEDNYNKHNSNAKEAPAVLVEEAYRKLGPLPDWIETSVPVLEWKEDDATFAEELKAYFDRDGVVAIRGSLAPELLQRLDKASAEIIQEQYEKKKSKPKGALTGKPKKQPQGTQFFTVKEGAIFLGLDDSTNDGPDSITTDADLDKSLPPFLEVALRSKIPQVIAKILLPVPSNETLRLMRDIFLAKDTDEYICGWHVDDTGFWPATAEAPGVNAWIALDDMPVEGGGGFALAVGSHTADWRHDAYQITGSTHTFPPEGFTSAKDIVERRVGNGTCNVATAAPHLHRRLEETKRVYNMKRGDVIFHTRWLFHRTVPFERIVVEERQQQEPPLLYRRYSLRYGPGSSEIPKGYGSEPSVLWNIENAGRTADQVVAEDAPWYPQAWPTVLDDSSELPRLQEIAKERLGKVTRHAEARRQQMRQARKLATRQQMNRQPH